MMRKVCVVTGSRADYGLLYWVLKGLQVDPAFTLQIVATGMHLSPEFGYTVRVLEQDGFSIDAKVESLLSSDTAVGVAKAIGLGVIGFADVFDRLRPDWVLLLGDRFEVFAAVQAALVARIPVAHIAGGDITEGAFDEAIRHSITKMAHLHFTTNTEAARRVIQMGEMPESVFNVGSPGIDYIKRMKLLDRTQVEAALGFNFHARNILVTFHPETMGSTLPGTQFRALLEVLVRYAEDNYGILFTYANADNGGRELIRLIKEFIEKYPSAKAYASLGQQNYLSLVACVDVVVGNSSSGLYEVPSFKKPTVNIGDRQKGRLYAASVVNCAATASAIAEAMEIALKLDCSGTVNPYGDGDSSQRIIDVLKAISEPKDLLNKTFHCWGRA